jgi:hypothetical protein
VSDATLSVDGWRGDVEIAGNGIYRYSLSREWDDGRGTVLWIMLNPSTADAIVNDPTIRRCIGFSRAWGAKRLDIRNLFAYRATDPADMVKADGRRVDIIGPENDERIAAAHGTAMTTIVAWGAHPIAAVRSRVVRRMLFGRPVFCLGTTKAGAPRHPLYVPSNFAPVEFGQ